MDALTVDTSQAGMFVLFCFVGAEGWDVESDAYF